MAVAVPYSHFAPNLTDARDNTVTIRTVNYEIVHQVDGRLRLRVPRLSSDAKFADRLADSVSALPNIKTARVNRGTASLVLTYRRGPGGSGHGPSGSEAVLSAVIGCIRTAAKADVARNIASERQASQQPQEEGVSLKYLVKQLGLPALGLGLSAAATVGAVLPPVLVGGAVAAATMPHALRAIQGLRSEKRLTVEILDVTAVGLLLAQSSFLAPAFMMAVIEGAEVVRALTARRVRQANLDLLSPGDRTVLVERSGSQQRVKAATIVPGDVVLLGAGDRVPGDGTVLEGNARVDEHRVVGAAEPAHLERGDEVYAATVVLEGQLRVRVRQTGQNTHIGRILAARSLAPKLDTRVSNYARKTGNWAVAPTLGIAGAVWLTSGSMARATGIVALDFGLGMRVSAPIAILAAQSRGVREGVSIRSGRAMEMLGRIDTAVFTLPTTPSAAVIAALRTQGIEGYLAGSDGTATEVAALATALGINPQNAYAGLSPQEKMDLVGALQAGGKRVAVVGEQVDDTAAMAHADVAVSFGGADALAKETADVVLDRNDPADLLVGLQIARDVQRTLKQNQTIVVGSNSIGIAYGALAVLNPIAGVLINNGVALVAAMNGLRPLVSGGRIGKPLAAVTAASYSRQDES